MEDHIISHAMNSMSDRIFIDTNILFYAYDQDAGAKHEIAKKLIGQCWEQANGVLSIQVLCEFFVRITRKVDPAASLGETESLVKNLAYNWEIVTPDIYMVMEAIRGRRTYLFSFWDAMIWAAAKSSGIKKLYTEDFQHGQIVEGVEFINPFKVEDEIDLG